MTKVLIDRSDLRDLFLVEIEQENGSVLRFYEGVVYNRTAEGLLKESPEKPTFHVEDRAAAEAWLLKGSDPDS